MAVRLRVRLGPEEKPWEDHLLDDVDYCGWSGFFGAPWGDVVRKESVYFINGSDSFCVVGMCLCMCSCLVSVSVSMSV